METKEELGKKAKSLIESSPAEAVEIYNKMWENYSDLFNAWDAFFTIKAMRKTTSPNMKWAYELVSRFNEKEPRNIYGWLVFDACVKGKTRDELISNEHHINSLSKICGQKDLRTDNEFPCPTTICILSLSTAFSKPSFNAAKIESLLNQLNSDFLSLKPGEPKDKNDAGDEFASDFEKFCSLKTKALLRLNKFQECINLCELSLKTLNKFHYGNDMWFKMRIGIAESELGNHTISEDIFKELIESRAGTDKWFFYKDIAEVYYDKADFGKAWKYAVDSALHGNEPHFLIELYLLQARILYKLDRSEEGKIIAELIAAILRDQKWKDKDEYTKLFSYYKIDRLNLTLMSDILNKARKFWQDERYGNMPKAKGTIISIREDGKTGRIKSQNGKIASFYKKDFVKKFKSIENLEGALVEYFEMESFNGKLAAECISIFEQPKKNSNSSETELLIGKIVEGTVTNIVEFGIFFQLPGCPDGLLHRNNLPENLKNNFNASFTKGDKVMVKIDRVTEKGIKLEL